MARKDIRNLHTKGELLKLLNAYSSMIHTYQQLIRKAGLVVIKTPDGYALEAPASVPAPLEERPLS